MTTPGNDLIEPGAERFCASDLERIALLHPAISAAVCLSIRHPARGQRPVVVVVRKTGAEVSLDEVLTLYAGCTSQPPEDVLFVEHLPLDAGGQVHRGKLRELCVDLVPWSCGKGP